MPSYFAQTAEQVKAVVETVKERKPVYDELLQFYGRLFVIQEESKSRIRLEPIRIPEDILSIKAREKMPLIDINGFSYHRKESRSLFMVINHLAKESNPKLSNSAETIVEAVGTKLTLEDLFSGLLEGNETIFEDLAVEISVDKQVLGFLAYNSLKPSLCLCADQLGGYLDQSTPWVYGYCPICGSAPILSMIEPKGRRSLVCSFCWKDWPVNRVQCAFCGGSQTKDLHYFYSEEEKEARVDLCDRGRRRRI